MNPLPGLETAWMPPVAPPLCSAVAMPAAWKIASGIAPMRDHWVILRRPDSPSFWIALRLGMICTSSWITIEAEMYRSEEHTSELQSLMRISYAVFCLKKKKSTHVTHNQY